MSTFRHRPSHRRQRSPKASWLVLGHPAADILYHGRTAHLLPVKGTDHRRRYSVGQRLAVKEYVPGPSECHVHLTGVEGPASTRPFTLGQVDYSICRELGHVRLDALWRYWLINYDQAWLSHAIEAGTDTDEEIARRFDMRWAGKLAWLLRFEIDIAAAPHLLAARSDELYVESDAMALRGEKPALTEAEWEMHIGPKSRYRAIERIADQRVIREAMSVAARLDYAKARARGKGYDIRDECRRFDRLMQQGRHEKALEQLERIESRVFPVAA